MGQLGFGVGCDLLIWGLPRSLQSTGGIRVTGAESGLPCTGPGQHGPRLGRVRVIEVTRFGRACRTTPERRPPGPGGPTHSSRRTRWGQRAELGATCRTSAGVPAAQNASGGGAAQRQSGPARAGPGPSITEASGCHWMGVKFNERRQRAACDASLRPSSFVQIDPDCVLNSATPRA